MAALLQRFAPLLLAFFLQPPVPPDPECVGTAADPAATAARSGSKRRRLPAEPPRTVHVPTVDVARIVRSGSSGGGGGGGAAGGAGASAHVHAAASTEGAGAMSSELMRRRVVQFVGEHREVVNAMVRAEPLLLATALAPVVAVRDCRAFLDFHNKVAFFRSQLRAYNTSRGGSSSSMGVSLRLNRRSVFDDSYAQLAAAPADALRGRLDVRFRGEEGVDAGGLTREWFEILARDMFNPNYALFAVSEDGTTFQPHPQSSVNPEHLMYFRFVGRVLGKAVADGQLLDAHFTRSFYKHMLGVPVTFQDMEGVDPQLYRSLKDILDMNIDGLGLEMYFAADTEFGGTTTTVELVPGGSEVEVTDANKADYVQLLAAHRMTSSILAQTNAFLAGFHELIPPSLISVFTESELELLIAGLPSIDVADLRANTEYVNFRVNDEVITWFWEALESFDQQDRARFLMFVTGTSKVPPGGFKALRGQRGAQRFTIERSYGSEESLPQSHTCFNTINITAAYSSAEVLREKLLIAIREGGEGFGMV